MVDHRLLQGELDDQRQKVDVDNYTITVRELLGMAERGELHRAPEYQRKFRWDEEAESRLIESILLGLPVPNFFFAANQDGSWEVVDGLQRLSTLIHFASGDTEQMNQIRKDSNLRLTGLLKLKNFNGYRFHELPSPIQLAFTKRGMGVTALSDKSDPSARFETFERLNRGAVKLTPQEVRACVYQGPFNTMLRTLAAYESFSALVKLQSQNQENATLEEQVLKFFAYLNARDEFSGDVEGFLDNYMKLRKDDEGGLDGMRDEFIRVVDSLYAIIGGPLLRTKIYVTPLNELEAVMVAAAEVLRERPTLGTPPVGWLDDDALVAASTGGTNTRKKLTDRISRARELLIVTD